MRFNKIIREVKSSVSQKVVILIASGGSFAFTLLLGKYWSPEKYGEIVSGFSIVSYLSFPFLFGFIPNLLRLSGKNGNLNFSEIFKQRMYFLGAYFFCAFSVLFLLINDISFFLTIGASIIIVLATGVGEAILRDKQAVNVVFHVRALGISLGVVFIFLTVYLNYETSNWFVYAARFFPSAIVLLFIIISGGYIAKYKQPNNTMRISEDYPSLGIIEATLIAVSIGIFQYLFVIIGHKIVPQDEFVAISIGLITSITITQRLSEPHLYRIFFENKRIVHGANLPLFIELFIFSLGAQFMALLLVGGNFSLLDATLFSMGSAFASLACIHHYSIFMHAGSVKYSAVVFLLLVFLIVASYILELIIDFPTYYLLLAVFYFSLLEMRISTITK